MEEIISQLSKNEYGEGWIGNFFHRFPLITHLLYADDMLVFANGKRRSIRQILKTLELYANWSKQMVNKDKLALVLSNKIGSNKKRGLLQSSGFVEGSFPTR